MEITVSGIVIREKLQGESDKMLTILTPAGKIYAYAKGVKNISSKNAPACQVFSYSDFEIIEKNGRKLIKTAYIKEMFYGMRSDMSRYSLACYFADVMCHVATENNDETESLRLLLNALFALSSKQEIPIWQVKGAFELRLMCIIGFMPSLTNCPYCDSERKPSKSNVFSLEDGGIICETCKSKHDHIPFSCTVNDTVLSAVSYICLCPVERFLSFKMDGVFSAEFSFLCENYLIHKVERGFETLKIYKSIVNSLQNT